MDSEEKRSAELEADDPAVSDDPESGASDAAEAVDQPTKEELKAARERERAEKKAAKELEKAEKQAAKEKAEAEMQAAKEQAAAEKAARKEAAKREKLQQSLRLSDATARSLLDRIDTAVAFHEIVRDEHGEAVDYRVLEVNQAFEGVIGQAASDVVSEPASQVYGRGKAAPFLADILAALDEGVAKAFEGAVRSTRAKLRLNVVPMAADLFALMVDDITEAKKAESRANARRSYLETRLKNLTSDKKETDSTLAATRAELEATGNSLAATEKELAKTAKALEQQTAKLNAELEATGNSLAATEEELAKTAKALEQQTAKLNAEIGARKQLETALAVAQEARDKMRSALGDLSKAVES